MLAIEISEQIAKEAKEYIGGFTFSLMKRPEQFAPGEYPIYLAKGEGAQVTDVDGNVYTDYICGLGATSLGHNHPAVVKAITENLDKGLIHSLPTEIEVTVAKNLISIIPGAEMARFFKTGADATSAAVRLSRHVTKREKVITIGYNGWHDHFMYDTPGVPDVLAEYTTRMPLFSPDDEPKLFDAIDEIGDELACILLSVPYNRILTKEFLLALKEKCKENGCMFVLDEIVTGFRLALGGVQEYFGVTADLVTVSKGLAAGMPLSAILGKREYLKELDNLQVSTTFGGEMLSLFVCNEVINEYKDRDVISVMAERGKQLRKGLNRISDEIGTPLKTFGYDPIPFCKFSQDVEKNNALMVRFIAGMAKRGTLFRQHVNFLCGVHTAEQIEITIEAARQTLIEMKDQELFIDC